MRFRRWTSFAAILSVLLHMGLLVRHNGVVLAAAYQQALGLQVSAWCGPLQPNTDWSSPFDSPAPKQQGSKCPICMGTAPAVALADIVVPVIDAPLLTAPRLVHFAETAAPRITTAPPPSRAPPLLA